MGKIYQEQVYTDVEQEVSIVEYRAIDDIHDIKYGVKLKIPTAYGLDDITVLIKNAKNAADAINKAPAVIKDTFAQLAEQAKAHAAKTSKPNLVVAKDMPSEDIKPSNGLRLVK